MPSSSSHQKIEFDHDLFDERGEVIGFCSSEVPFVLEFEPADRSVGIMFDAHWAEVDSSKCGKGHPLPDEDKQRLIDACNAVARGEANRDMRAEQAEAQAEAFYDEWRECGSPSWFHGRRML